jgi:hypothetical protein
VVSAERGTSQLPGQRYGHLVSAGDTALAGAVVSVSTDGDEVGVWAWADRDHLDLTHRLFDAVDIGRAELGRAALETAIDSVGWELSRMKSDEHPLRWWVKRSGEPASRVAGRSWITGRPHRPG